jgi:hypothetical protein
MGHVQAFQAAAHNPHKMSKHRQEINNMTVAVIDLVTFLYILHVIFMFCNYDPITISSGNSLTLSRALPLPSNAENYVQSKSSPL